MVFTLRVPPRERRRLQAKHLWMEIKLRWRVLEDRMYTKAPKSKEELELCFLTGLPSATTRIRMKKNHIVVLQSKKSKPGGNNAKSGWHTSKDKMRRWSSTSRAFSRHYLVRKQKLSLKWMHLWSIVQKGGRLERALINSSGVD